MYTRRNVEVDDVSSEVIALYTDPVNALSGSQGAWQCRYWHSSKVKDNPYPWFDSTFDRVKSSIGDLYIDEWWFTCGAPGDEYSWHVHSRYAWTGVLYIQTPENSGGIEFKNGKEHQIFCPQVGDFLLFPGTLAHRVLKNLSNDYRISVAFNLR